MDKAPAYKLKGLLPKGTRVKVYQGVGRNNDGASTSGPNRVWLVRSSDDLIINRELVRTGFAFVRKGGTSIPDVVKELNELENNARQNGLGIFKLCQDDKHTKQNDATTTSDSVADSNFVAQFEPLEYTTQTSWSDDGGTTILLPKQTAPSIPTNPGDVKGCSDFDTYEEALSWYETYYPYYGDVAKLDRKNKGVPCSGLPHTSDRMRYRMKRPNIGGGTLLN
jgi:hypothetical protein